MRPRGCGSAGRSARRSSPRTARRRRPRRAGGAARGWGGTGPGLLRGLRAGLGSLESIGLRGGCFGGFLAFFGLFSPLFHRARAWLAKRCW